MPATLLPRSGNLATPPARLPVTAGVGERQAPSRRPAIPPLTSLRFVAAMLVFCSHVILPFGSHPGWLEAYQRIFIYGFIGVPFFFILSGFILTYNYAGRLPRGLAGYRSFLAARIGRIYPVHLLTFLLVLPLTLTSARQSHAVLLRAAAANLTLTQSWVSAHQTYFQFNGVSWSLSNELTYYVAFPLLLVMFLRAARWRAWLPLLCAGCTSQLLHGTWHTRIPCSFRTGPST